MTQQSLLTKLITKSGISQDDVNTLITQLCNEELPPEQFAGVLSIIADRGATPEVITFFAAVMRTKMISIHGTDKSIDICGTGGDGHNTLNISTASMFVLSGAGQYVAKHGNRAASSQSGSADVLEALGATLSYDVQAAVDANERAIFMFAPNFHPAMKAIAPVRRVLGIPTVFNILGPLLNPAHVKYQLIGVPSKEIAERIAATVKGLPYTHVCVIYNDDGIDELTVTSTNYIIDIHDGIADTYTLEAQDVGLTAATIAELSGGTAKENAMAIKQLLQGAGAGAFHDTVVLNAGFALYVAGRAATPQHGIAMAMQSIKTGAANVALESYIASTKVYAND